MTDSGTNKPSHFIRHLISEDLAQQKNQGRVVTRFPPEPNGYLHIGHAKSICLNFGMAEQFGGYCNLRFDDTNPCKESQEYVDAIKTDVAWLGWHWQEPVKYASDYFQGFYDCALQLIKRGKAYVCDLSPEEIRDYRGTLTEAGRPSPFRERSVEENLRLFEKMKNAEAGEHDHVLRAKIDMASGNINLRDPIIYRTRHISHHQTGDAWHLYPMYDFAHGLSDAFEGVTHSLCTLEFEDHRPLYDWFLEQLQDLLPSRPEQTEFARLNLQYTITSKRKLNALVSEGHVEGWDDPRMPTLAGLRRRGVPPQAIREFCERIGVSKADNSVEMEMLDACIREQLDPQSPRAMAVLRPLKLVIENYPETQTEALSAANHPQDESMGRRQLAFGRELYIDRNDFKESLEGMNKAARKSFKRLVLGQEVRLRYAYVIKCESVVKDEQGNIIELRCSYDPDTLGRNPEDRKVKGVIHWVSVASAVTAEVRLYDRLFQVPHPDADKEGRDFHEFLNPRSLEVIADAKLEPSLAAQTEPLRVYQFEREGYFCLDSAVSETAKLRFNQTIGLKDSWAKINPT